MDGSMSVVLLYKLASSLVGALSYVTILFFGVSTRSQMDAAMEAQELQLEALEAREEALEQEIEVDGEKFKLEIGEDGAVEIIPVEPAEPEAVEE